MTKDEFNFEMRKPVGSMHSKDLPPTMKEDDEEETKESVSIKIEEKPKPVVLKTPEEELFEKYAKG